MDIKQVECINIDVLTEGYKLHMSGRMSTDRHGDWGNHSQAFTDKKALVKFIERTLEA